MDETRGTIRLVDSRPESESRGLVATIDRGEVEEALREDGPVDLLLDVERITADGNGRETQRLAIGWSTEELERLLASSSDDRLPLSFDESELRRLLDEDVEAHGMREKLAVLTVVAGMAAAGAGAAAGAIPREEGGAAATGAPVAAATQASEISTGLGQAAQLQTGRAPTASEVSTGVGTTQAPQTGRAAAASEVSTGIVGQAPVAPSEISTGVVQQPPVAPAEVTTGIVSQPEATPIDSTGSGWNFDSTEVALTAGAILAVAAAGFMARTQRHRPAIS